MVTLTRRKVDLSMRTLLWLPGAVPKEEQALVALPEFDSAALLTTQPRRRHQSDSTCKTPTTLLMALVIHTPSAASCRTSILDRAVLTTDHRTRSGRD